MADSTLAKPAPNPRPPREDDTVVERRTLRDYYIILRERMWIALPLALITAVSIGYWEARKTPIYQAQATMQFERLETVVTSQSVTDPSIRSDVDIQTDLQILNSQRLRAKVLESFTPEEQKILLRPTLRNLGPGGSIAYAGTIGPGSLGSVTPEQVRGTYLITISVQHEDPEAAALIANRFVSVFIDYLFETVGGTNENAVDRLHVQVAQLRKNASDADNALQAYMKEHDVVSLDKSVDLVTSRLKSVDAALTTAQLKLLSLEDGSRQIAEFKKRGGNLLEISAIGDQPAVALLRAQLRTFEEQQALLADRYYELHPKMIALANQIERTRADLDRAIDSAVTDLATQVAQTRENVATLRTEYAAQQKEQFRLRGLSPEFNALEQNATAAKTYYSELLERLNQTTTSKNLEKIPLRPLDPATPNYTPASPNMGAITRKCVGIGLAIFFGVAIGLSFIDDRIKSAWDVESFIGVNLLGIIPDIPSKKDDEKYTLFVGPNEETANGTESFLGLYSAVKINSKLDFPKSILITSTIPGEGKTLISCNLAGCFARHGKRTLLVDCDMRRPMLHRHFKQSNTAGLISWFEQGAQLDNDLLSNPSLGITKLTENLYLLTSGGRSKSPTELLESPVFGQLLERLKKDFDLVVVDSPPMGAVTDSILIAERVDEVVYVCRFNRAYRKHIRLYIKALREGKNEILGIVLNGLSPRRIEYYSNYRYYRSYKKYYGSQV